jgi:hypothetical protein
VRLKDEAVNGVDCYVLQRTNLGWTVWVGKQDFLIRRYRNFISKARAIENQKEINKQALAKGHLPTLISSAQTDIVFTENYENIVVNENLKPADFIPPLGAAK